MRPHARPEEQHARETDSAFAIVAAVALIGCGFKPVGGHATGGTGNSAGSNQPVTCTGTGGGAGGSPVVTQGTPCQGLECQQSTCKGGNCAQPACPGGAVTTLTGKVYDPAGRVPLYNVDVYVPNGPLPDFQDGPSCDSCANRVSGHAVVRTTTDASGSFTLGDHDADVPAGSNIPLVVQIGKWRRQITIPTVAACTQTALTDPNQIRLPRDQSEGHIPKMALTTGQNDALECLLRKVGISDSEFTPETGNGRINFYAGGGGTSAYDSTLNGGAAFTPVHPWWDSLDNLKKYDIILHSCEGAVRVLRPERPADVREERGGAAGAAGLRRHGRPGVRVALARLLVRTGNARVQVHRDVQSPHRLAHHV